MAELDVTRELLLQKMTWEWQPLEPLIQELIPTVAPGLALRTYQGKLANMRKRRGHTPDPTREKTEDEQIASGARAIINARVDALRNSKRLEVENRDGERYIRFGERRTIPPQATHCPTCNHPLTAPAKKPLPPRAEPKRPQRKVLYPSIPAWNRVQEERLAGSSG